MSKIVLSASDLSHRLALVEVALEIQFGNLDHLLTQKDGIEDKIAELEAHIERLRHQAKKIEMIARKMEEILPSLMDAIGDDRQQKPCPSPDPRLDELYRLWFQDHVDHSEWKSLARRYSPVEKKFFARRYSRKAGSVALYGPRITAMRAKHP